MEDLFGYFKKADSKIVFLLIFILGLIVYANTFNNQLFWDDYDSIVNNSYVRDWKFLPNYLSENLTAGSGITDNYWRPLLLFTFSVDYHIGKLSPFFYHLENYLWHIIASFLVYLISYKLFKNKLAGLIASLLFLVHPLQTEAVTYVAGRADPMHAALLLLSFLFFYKYVCEKAGTKWYVTSLAVFAGALLTKERAIIFPALLILYFITLYPGLVFQDWKKKVIKVLPYGAIAVLYLILRMTVLHFSSTFDLGEPNNIGAQNFYQYFLAYCKGITIYAGLLIWPAKLYMEKSVSVPLSFLSFHVIIGLVITALSLFAVFLSFRRKKIWAFGILWFWIAFSPSFYIYPIQGLLYEHWLYFPLAGLFIAAFLFVAEFIQKEKSSIVRLIYLSILIIILAAFGARVIIRNNDWDNPVQFYEKNILLGGVSARVYTNLGMAYDDTKRHEDAINTYQKAVALDDRLFQPWYDMGNSYRDLKKYGDALAAYQKSVEINPYFMPAYYNSAAIYAESKDLNKAVDIMQEALIINPNNIQTDYNIGIIYYQKGDKDKAKEYFSKVLEQDPYNMELRIMINSL